MKRKAALLLAGMLVCSAALAGCSGGNQASNDYVTVGGYTRSLRGDERGRDG